MPKKKILILIDWFDPAFKAGGPIRSLVNFVSHMSKDFELFVVTSNHDLGSKQPLEGISSDTWINYGNKAQVFYASSEQLSSEKIVSIVHSINPDHIYLNSFFSKKFALLPLWLKKKGRINTNMVLAPRGMLRESALAFKPFKKSVFLYLFRLAGMHRLVKFQATDEYEKNDILKQFRDAEVGLAPNLPGAASDSPNGLIKKKGVLKILYVGRIHPVKNLLYLLSLLKDLEGEISCTLIGLNEHPAYWHKCEKLISEFSENITVNYLGEQAHERILKEISQHHIFALPTQGENFGHAIFEALSMGRPVLISDQTPWRNLEKQKAGWDLPLSEPNAFKAALGDAVYWDQKEFEEWMGGSLALAKRFIEQSDMRLNYLKLFN